MEKEFIAVKSESLSTTREERYIIINRQTREVVDDGLGRGYRSPEAAHKSFAYKQKFAGKKKSGRSNYPFKRKDNTTTTSQASAPAQQTSPVQNSIPTARVTPATVSTSDARRQSQPIPVARVISPFYANLRRRSVTQENTPPPPDLFGFRPEDK